LDDQPPHKPTAEEQLAERRKRRWQTPCPDPLYFLISQAPIEAWERDVLQVVREVGLHYRPQIRTKVINEGWAVRACLKILNELDLPSETYLAAAQLHAQVARPDPLHLNPYWLGWRLFEYLEATGQDVATIAELESDVSFLANWIDADFVRQEQLYNWDAVQEDDATVLRETSRAWERVRDRLVAAHTPPIPGVTVEDVAGDGTLRLRLGAPRAIDLGDAQRIIRGTARLWRAPVQLWAAQSGDQPPLCAAGPTDPDPEEDEPR
jgi:stage V sporulation protein R